MRSTYPPRLATLLLRRFAPPNDPLAGDLAEEYQRGRSGVWYWRQVVYTIAGGWLHNLDIHGIFAVQGPVMRFVMLGLLSFCVVMTGGVIYDFVAEHGLTRMLALLVRSNTWELGRLAVSFGAAIVIGWVIAQFHARHRTAAVVAFAASVMGWAIANLFFVVMNPAVDPLFAHLLAMIVFLSGLLVGGIHLAGHPDWPHPQRGTRSTHA